MYGLGRHQHLHWDGAEIAGVQTKGVTVNGEPVDISDDDSNGWREIYSEAGQIAVEISLSGLAKDWRLQSVAFTHTSRSKAVVLSGENGASISGNFFLQDYSQTMEYNGFTAFDATLISDGEITYVAGS